MEGAEGRQDFPAVAFFFCKNLNAVFCGIFTELQTLVLESMKG